MTRLIDEHTPDDFDGNDWADRYTHPPGEQPLFDPASILEAELAMLFGGPTLDDEGYVLEWRNISVRTRAARNSRCQYCSIQLDKRRDLLHVHHCDRDKTNNDDNNLLVLCALCHSQLDGHAHLKERISQVDLALIREMQSSVSRPPYESVKHTVPLVADVEALQLPEDEWQRFEVLVQRANTGAGATREEVTRELSRLITKRHPLALKAQRALINLDRSQGKIRASTAYEKGETLFDPAHGDSPFFRG